MEIGQVVSDKYKLLRLLGDGGMGSVYEAEHVRLGTHVAIKVLHSDLARRAGIAERFLQEARVSAQIRSPHVVQVTDVDRTPDGVAYLVMELLQGEPLAGLIKRERKLAVATACEYITQILQALEAAHALGVIHRDLKPDNVFVTFQGGKPVLKLIDFGIAKLKTAQAGQTKNLTVAGMLMGTPEYMAPEQAYSADKVDVRADLYAVGVMLYEMLSGQSPAVADDPRVLILKVERGEVTPLVQAAPGIEPQLAGFVHRAMAPRPELRFANATEMRLALEDVLRGKRAGTAKLAAAGGGGGTAPIAAPIAASAALADTAEARAEIGTGTVMGAPVDAALASPGASGPPPNGTRQRRDGRRSADGASAGDGSARDDACASASRTGVLRADQAPGEAIGRRPRRRARDRRAPARRGSRRRVRRRHAGAHAGAPPAADVRDGDAACDLDGHDAGDNAGHAGHSAHDLDGDPVHARSEPEPVTYAGHEEGRRRWRSSSAGCGRRRAACRRCRVVGPDHDRDAVRDVPVPRTAAAVLPAGSAVAADHDWPVAVAPAVSVS